MVSVLIKQQKVLKIAKQSEKLKLKIIKFVEKYIDLKIK